MTEATIKQKIKGIDRELSHIFNGDLGLKECIEKETSLREKRRELVSKLKLAEEKRSN